MAGYKERFIRSWKFILAIVIPLALLPLVFKDDNDMIPDLSAPPPSEDGGEISLRKSPKFKLAYVILVMAIYWGLEIIPLPITSLFPLVLFPLLGIDDSGNVSKSYMKESNTIFLGGAIVALAIEFCNLHRRVALRLINIVGVSPRRLMFGIMAVVSFLSMWISATTCMTMIVPIISAIVDEIHEVTDAANADAEIHCTAENEEHFPNPNVPGAEVTHNSTPPRHPVVFSNTALSSHNRDEGSSNGNGQRSTLGLLQGHRSDDDRNPINNSRHQYHRLSSPELFFNRRKSLESGRTHFVYPEVKPNPSLKPALPLQLTLVRAELASEGLPPGPGSNLQLPRLGKRASSCSVSSITEPGRIEMAIGLPSPASDCAEAEEKRRRMEKEKWRRIKNMYLFALAYAANIGGTATITGTGPNKVFKEVIKPYNYEISQDGKYLSMTFFTWMAFNVPPMLVNIVVAWIYLTMKYCGIPERFKTAADKAEHEWKEQQVRHYLQDEYKKLGKMKFHEIGVAIVFILVVVLWILRDPQVFTGWDESVSGSQTKTGDSTAALLGAVLLFVIPRSWSFLSSKEGAKLEALLDWKFVTEKLPWGVLLLLGSGYAIGDSAERTGLSRWFGEELYMLHTLPDPLLLLIVMLITTFVTEVVSNTACASVLLPVLLGVSQEMEIHPLYLSVAATVTASYAFMLPVASPVNAIVFAAGDFSIWEMITNGYILNGICVLVFYVNTLTLGEILFNYSDFTYPDRSELPGFEEVESLLNNTITTFS